jgi:lactoylglutathione lyase
MQKVKALGGVFFKTPDRGRLREWYAAKLGLDTEEWGAAFHWREADAPERKGLTVLGLFDSDTEHFAPSALDYMINFVVEDLAAFRRQLIDAGLEVSEIISDDSGHFAHLSDPDGRRVELWQPPQQQQEAAG